MITIGMNYQILPGKNEAFEKACNGVINAMADMDGHTKSFLFKDVNNPQSYLIMSDWSDRAAFDAFIASEQFRNVANWGKEQILAGRPSHNYFEH
jgi:heme-degrading monooxygenase HmoA